MSEIEVELAMHIDIRAYELERDGLSPAAARLEARKKFGSLVRIVEEMRETHSFAWLDTRCRDSVYSLRGLLRRLMISDALAACYGPARQAARLDPAMVLRHD